MGSEDWGGLSMEFVEKRFERRNKREREGERNEGKWVEKGGCLDRKERKERRKRERKKEERKEKRGKGGNGEKREKNKMERFRWIG